jgi:membrane-associated phospholipid phosphatase
MISQALDYIGFQGPVITFGITTVALLNQKPYLLSYLVFFAANTYLNKFLKMAIKQPRPEGSKMISMMDHNDGHHKYGMPSGHAQWTSFSLTYLYLVKQNVYLLLLETFILALTLYQRWKYNRHSIEQLVVGTIVGSGFACASYYFTREYLRTA